MDRSDQNHRKTQIVARYYNNGWNHNSGKFLARGKSDYSEHLQFKMMSIFKAMNGRIGLTVTILTMSEILNCWTHLSLTRRAATL